MKFSSLREYGDRYGINFDMVESFEDIVLDILNSDNEDMIPTLFASVKKHCPDAIDTTSTRLFDLGLKYEKEGDYEKMKEYYQIEIEKGNANAMFNLGHYYHTKVRNYKKMKHYYDMAIKRNHSYAMCNMANYHHDRREYKDAEKYYLMAIRLDNPTAMNNLGNMYMKQKKYSEAIQYLKLSADRGSISALFNMGCCYKEIGNYELMVTYYELGVEKRSIECALSLSHYYAENTGSGPRDQYLCKKYIMMAVNFGYKIKKEWVLEHCSDLEIYIGLGKDIYKELKRQPPSSEVNIYINKKSKVKEVSDCMICMADDRCIPLECTHTVCDDCYMRYHKTRCEYCKISFT